MPYPHLDITWFPNSWIRSRIANRVIYFDHAYLKTYFTEYADKTEFSKWPGPIDGLPNGLEKADYIFVTHHHKDHCKKVTIDRLTKSVTKIFAPEACKKELGAGVNVVRPLDVLQIAEDVSVKVVDAYNTQDGSSTRKQHKKGKGVGYILTIAGVTVYHLGDTDFLPEMEAAGKVDIAFIPMGGKFTMDADEAVRATLAIRPTVVIPIHNLGQDFSEFSARLKGTGIRCIIPVIGQVTDLGSLVRLN